MTTNQDPQAFILDGAAIANFVRLQRGLWHWKQATRHYAALVSRRLRGADTSVGLPNDPWPVDRIADVYEIVASLNEDPEERRAAAFVAGTAQQIIARRMGVASETVPPPVDRDGVDAGLAAALLFLAAEQYADANEAAGPLALPRSGMEEAREIGRHVRDFARGNLTAILDRAAAAPIDAPAADGLEATPASGGGLEEKALRLLLGQIVTGLEHLAAYVMSANEAPAGDYIPWIRLSSLTILSFSYS